MKDEGEDDVVTAGANGQEQKQTPDSEDGLTGTTSSPPRSPPPPPRCSHHFAYINLTDKDGQTQSK